MVGKNRSAGYSLIEILLVIALVAILGIVAASTLGPNSPAAVRSALLDLRGAFINARNLAATSGQPVAMVVNTTTATINFHQVASTGALVQPPLNSLVVRDSWKRWAEIKSNMPSGMSVPPSGDALTAIEPLFKAWTSTMDPSLGNYGFLANGQPVRFAGNVVVPLADGFWVGVAGRAPNRSGNPFGFVAINGQGMVMAFYKADSQIDDVQEFKWKRLD